MERGNRPATVDVRPHFYAGATLLAAGAVGVVLSLADVPRHHDLATLVALVGGMLLFLQGIALWYLPSFAKRRVALVPLAQWAGVVLFPLAAVAAAFDLFLARDLALGLATLSFGVVVLVSALRGARWRGGVPFWRTPGPFRAGDAAAAATLAAGAGLLVLGGLAGAALSATNTLYALLGAFAPVPLLVLGMLAHLLPRSRARPLPLAPYAAGALALLVAPLALVVPFGPRFLALHLLVVASALAPVALALPGGEKRAGPRLREAGPVLVAALATLLLALALLLVGDLVDRRATFPALLGLLLALVLGLAGLSLLALPVLFNQRPDARLLPVALALAVLGWLGLAAAHVLAATLVPGAVALALALLAWLGALAPLRTPRRVCPPDGEPS